MPHEWKMENGVKRQFYLSFQPIQSFFQFSIYPYFRRHHSLGTYRHPAEGLWDLEERHKDLSERFLDLAEGLRDFGVLRKDFGISRKDFERKSVQDLGFFAGLLWCWFSSDFVVERYVFSVIKRQPNSEKITEKINGEISPLC